MIDSGKVRVTLIAIKNINNENYISICDKIVLVSDTDGLTFEDMTTIIKILVGCTRLFTVIMDQRENGAIWL